MSRTAVTVVRVYITEASGKLPALMRYLHDESKVHGVTVFRGTTGFGRSGKMHSSSLLDMSLDLPVVIEFFDTPERVEPILERLEGEIEPGHIVSWSAFVSV